MVNKALIFIGKKLPLGLSSSKNTGGHWSVTLLLLSLNLTAPLWAQPSPTDSNLKPFQLLEKMLVSRRQAFDALLTYEQGGHNTAIRQQRRLHGETIYDRIEYLNGAPSVNEFWSSASCLTPSPSTGYRPFHQISKLTSALPNYYNFFLRGSTRIGGRIADEILMLPIDGHRLGFGFAIDKKTGITLQSITLSPNKKVLERMQVVELTTDNLASIPTEVKTAQSSDCQHTLTEPDSPAADNQRPATIVPKTHSGIVWEIEYLPQGFELLSYYFENNHWRLLYSDGISRVSILIGPSQGSLMPIFSYNRGGTVVYVGNKKYNQQQYLISIVGEIPVHTARLMLNNTIAKGSNN